MVITLVSIFNILLIVDIFGFVFKKLNNILNKTKLNQSQLKGIIKRSALEIVGLMTVLLIDTKINTIKNIGTLMYNDKAIMELSYIFLIILLIILAQHYWKAIVRIIKDNIKHVNKSDALAQINRLRNKQK